MKCKLKFLSVAFVLILLLGVTTGALALQGQVHGGVLRLRKNPIPSGIYWGYIPNGTIVTVYDDGTQYSDNGQDWFYYINAWSYDSNWNYAYRDGYGMVNFINLI